MQIQALRGAAGKRPAVSHAIDALDGCIVNEATGIVIAMAVASRLQFNNSSNGALPGGAHLRHHVQRHFVRGALFTFMGLMPERSGMCNACSAPWRKRVAHRWLVDGRGQPLRVPIVTPCNVRKIPGKPQFGNFSQGNSV